MMETTAHPARSLMSFCVDDPPDAEVTVPLDFAAARSLRKCEDIPSSATLAATPSQPTCAAHPHYVQLTM